MTLLNRIKSLSPRARLFVWIVGAELVFDQITKYWAVARLTRAFEPVGGPAVEGLSRLGVFLFHRHPPRGDVVAVIDSFWHFRYVENPGAAWGFLSGSASWFRVPFFLLVAVLAMGFMISYFRKSLPEQGLLRVALALVFGGALGNFFDRVRLGYVIDFIDWHYYDQFTWPTFNIADVGISIGVGMLVLDMFLYKNAPAQGPAGDKSSPQSAKA